ncbi:MAG: aspartate 1-decarboxylase [bacterium]
MEIEVMRTKIHRATVTDADLHYRGSITIDADLMDEAGLHEHEKVQVLDINNGERLQTYTIAGDAGSGVICLNGAAARKVQPEDKVIIIAYGRIPESEVSDHTPTVVHVNEHNRPVEVN